MLGLRPVDVVHFHSFQKKSHNVLIQITLELTLNNNTMQPHCFNGKTRTTRSTSLILPADQRAYHPILCGKKQLLFVVQCEKSKPAWEVREQLLAMKGGFVPQVRLIPYPAQVISWKCGFGRMRTLVLVTLIRKHGFKLFLGSFSLWTGSSTLRAFLAGVPLHVHVAMLIPDFDSKGCSFGMEPTLPFRCPSFHGIVWERVCCFPDQPENGSICMNLRAIETRGEDLLQVRGHLALRVSQDQHCGASGLLQRGGGGDTVRQTHPHRGS